MRGRLQQGRRQLVAGPWLAAALATAVYLLTLDRSVSWWDCGEFIATGWTLGVGHPPGAPTYQLLAHLAMLLSMGDTAWVAPLSNAVSALCAGATVGLLFATMRLLGCRQAGAWTGSLCYLFCHTAWFSAVESEVYAMAMLFCSLLFYLALRFRRDGNPRLLPLMGLLAGLGAGVHMLTLLALPASMLLALGGGRLRRCARLLPAVALFFALGTSTYAIIPIRAAASPSINEYGSGFAAYVGRARYEHAPLYPRMWRQDDSDNWPRWSAGLDGLAGNAVYTVVYQLGYMYGRYLLDNFGGRVKTDGHGLALYVLPLVLAALGVWGHFRRRRRDAWPVLLLLLFGGPLLNLYLNHPCFEPRERDYVYVLSFYAVAVWIGAGADELLRRCPPRLKAAAPLVLAAAPLAMATGNWSDHDRSHCHSVHDIAMAHLQPCQPGALLVTLGDNETFPLWYLQQVERVRTDVEVVNIGLAGWGAVRDSLASCEGRRPVYMSHYCARRLAPLYGSRMRCEGFCWRLLPEGADTSALPYPPSAEWHIASGEYVDPVSRQFLEIWQANTVQGRLFSD